MASQQNQSGEAVRREQINRQIEFASVHVQAEWNKKVGDIMSHLFVFYEHEKIKSIIESSLFAMEDFTKKCTTETVR